MIIDCICGKKKFKLADGVMPAEGSKVRCGSCSEVWFFHPDQGNISEVEEKITDNVKSYQTETVNNQTSKTITETPPASEDIIDNTNESIQDNDPDELLSNINEDELTQDLSNEKSSKESVSNFKIFTDGEDDLPSKSEMDKNLDEFIVDRDKNLNFFQKLFKKDRISEASKSLEKEQKQKQLEKEKKNSDDARRTRFLFYLLVLLLIVFSIILVPFRDKIGMAFPFMESYLELLIPMYDYIKVPLGLK